MRFQLGYVHSDSSIQIISVVWFSVACLSIVEKWEGSEFDMS